MLDVWWTRLRGLGADCSGNFAIEFALALPILFLLLVGLLDLGRYSLQKSALLQGAREGVQYGTVAPNDTANIETTAQNATGLTGVTATASTFCECSSAPGTALADCTVTCSGGATRKQFVRVRLSRSFTSVLVPSSVTVGFGSWTGSWVPATTVTAEVTLIVP